MELRILPTDPIPLYIEFEHSIPLLAGKTQVKWKRRLVSQDKLIWPHILKTSLFWLERDLHVNSGL